ncbi:MAG: hypothetical protein IJ386_05515 [Clostridia bacterium]|nr:hypothetical protein [Clostridia bacterium]
MFTIGKLKKAAAVTVICTALLLSACGEDTKAPAVTGTGTGEVSQTAETTALPAETTNVIYQSEVENNMNVYKIKTFESIDAVDWDSVTAASVNNYKWVECEKYETWAKLVYVKDWGFLCRMTCIEDAPVATYTTFDDPVCLDSCMEFFAIWDNGDSYLNIESNSTGTMCIGYGISRESRRTALRYLKLEDMFKMNPVVEDGRWTLTMEIPIEKLQKFYKNISAETFVSGYSFTGNFYKTGGADNTGNEHYAMWNEVGTETPDFHRPEYFGKFIIE